jgi:sulfur-oxidizing protein SoxY
MLRGDDPTVLSPLEREHLPLVRLPVLTNNGAKVPIIVEMDHPMTPEHHIRSVRVTNPRDPVPSKGTFQLTPANGRVYVSFQFRVDAGPSNVIVTAECNRHGSWSTSRTLVVPDDAGG